MAGKVFPKTFKFTGWHPGCRCFATAVQPTEEEMDRLADMTEEEQAYLQKKQVKTMPKEYTKWIDDNAERIANAKNIPYFIKDNYVDGDISKGFKWEQKGKPKTAKEILAEKHALRTKEQVQAIKDKWQAHNKEINRVMYEGKVLLDDAEVYGVTDVNRLASAVSAKQIH